MYLAIDIGGTKTLLAVFDESGGLVESVKFLTSQDYDEFLSNLSARLLAMKSGRKFASACVAVPGLLDREHGVVHALGNLPWLEKPIGSNVAAVLDTTPVILENDSRLAGLAAAQPLKDLFSSILYLTISTGIGGALISDGQIVRPLQDMEIGKIPLYYEGTLQHWENFAGGRAIVEKYHKKASEIDDDQTWQQIADAIGYGVAVASSTLQPDAIVFGGGVGQFADRFIPRVNQYMDQVLHAIAKRPKLMTAQNPEEVVIYGCYQLAKSHAETN